MNDDSELVSSVVRGVLQQDWEHPDNTAATEAAWTQARDLGWYLLGVPETQGGVGGTFEDRLNVAGLLGEFGRRGPLLEVTAAVAHISGQPGVDDSALEDGRVAVISADEFGTDDNHYVDAAGPLAQVAVAYDDEIRIGTPSSQHVPATGGDELTVVTLDPTGPSIDNPELARTVRRELALTRCARIVGACRAAARMSARHATEREQFGRPLARFQAVGGLLTDLRMAEELAAASVRGAATAAPTARGPLGDAAVWICCDAASKAARSAHQVHGAMGITHEHPLHRITRRLWTWRDQLGADHARASRLGDWATRTPEPDIWDLLRPEPHT